MGVPFREGGALITWVGFINAYTSGYAWYRGRRTHGDAFTVNLTLHIVGISLGGMEIPRPIDRMALQRDQLFSRELLPCP